MNLLEGQVKPLLRIGLAFVLVWFYHGITTGVLSGMLQLLVVIVLSFSTWIIIFKTIYPNRKEG